MDDNADWGDFEDQYVDTTRTETNGILNPSVNHDGFDDFHKIGEFSIALRAFSVLFINLHGIDFKFCSTNRGKYLSTKVDISENTELYVF